MGEEQVEVSTALLPKLETIQLYFFLESFFFRTGLLVDNLRRCGAGAPVTLKWVRRREENKALSKLDPKCVVPVVMGFPGILLVLLWSLLST